jgi:hypothetical protein
MKVINSATAKEKQISTEKSNLHPSLVSQKYSENNIAGSSFIRRKSLCGVHWWLGRRV